MREFITVAVGVLLNREGSMAESPWVIVDADRSDGSRYKVLTIRHEARGNFEVVLLHETRSGAKTI